MNRRMRLPIFTLCVIVFFLAGTPLFAQGQQQSQQQGQQQGQQQSNPPQQTQRPSLQNPQQNAQPAAPAVDPKEEAAFKSFYDLTPAKPEEYDNQIQLGEAFLKDYPQSRYRETVYSRLTNAYFEKRDMAKMYSASDSALALNPNDLTVLTLVGWVIPRGDPSTPDFPQRLAKAEQYEKHALDLLPTLAKPQNLSDQQFTDLKGQASSQAHSGLGMVYFRETKFDQSSTELAKATDGVSNPDPTDYFVLGIDYEQLQKYPDSIKAFDSCSQIDSSLRDQCKAESSKVKAKEGAAPPHKP